MSLTNICIIFSKKAVTVISSDTIQDGSAQMHLRAHAAINY